MKLNFWQVLGILLIIVGVVVVVMNKSDSKPTIPTTTLTTQP